MWLLCQGLFLKRYESGFLVREILLGNFATRLNGLGINLCRIILMRLTLLTT